MGSDDGGAWTQEWTGGVEVKVPGVGVSPSDWEKWTSLGKFVEILGVRDVGLVRTQQTDMLG